MSTYDLSRRARVTMAGTGIVGSVVFFLVAFFTNLPMYGDSLVKYGSWAPGHRSEASHEIGLLLLSYLLYLLFGVFVATVVRGLDPWSELMSRIALVTIGVKFAVEVVQVCVRLVPAAAAPSTSPPVPITDFGESMAQFGSVVSIAGLIPNAVFWAAIGVGALVSLAVPRWLGWFTLSLGALQLVSLVLGFVVARDDPLLFAVPFVGFLGIPGWPLATGIT